MMTDNPQTAPHPDRLIFHGNGPEVEAAHDLPTGLDAESSGVGDAVPVVPDGSPKAEHPPLDAPTHAVTARAPC